MLWNKIVNVCTKKSCQENILRLKKVDLDVSEYNESKFYNPDEET